MHICVQQLHNFDTVQFTFDRSSYKRYFQSRESRRKYLSSRSIDIATDLFRSKRVRKRLDWSNIDPVLQKALPSIILIDPRTCSFDSVSASKATNYISNTMRVTWYSERKYVKRCSGEISTVHSSFAYGPRYHAIQVALLLPEYISLITWIVWSASLQVYEIVVHLRFRFVETC